MSWNCSTLGTAFETLAVSEKKGAEPWKAVVALCVVDRDVASLWGGKKDPAAITIYGQS